MADLNSTIVRGKLRVTEDINTNGNIVGSSIIGSGSGLTNLNASNISSGTLSMDRHYSPTADKGSELTATLPGEAGAYAKDTEYTVLTGVKAQRDAKGHVTGLTYTAQKIKDTNTTYTFNGAVSTIKDNNLTGNRALISDNSGKIAVSDVTSAELSYLDGVTSSIQTQLNAKLDKTTYEWNKEFVAGSNGAISLGRYNVYDSQLTFDITSTTNQSLSGKLVIATQNGTIHQAKVFGDASGTLVSKLIIYQSAISNSRSWVEVFCNFNGWSKNKVHIYAVALNSATVEKQMTSVTISNGVPAAANVTSGDTKWTGAIVNDFSHSHGISIKTSSGANQLTLAHGTKYELTAGGQSFIFTTPSDNNTSHSHSAGVGLIGSGSAGTGDGTYTYKAKLRSETALTVDSAAAITSGRVYPVAVDKSGYLSLNVPLAGFEDILKGIKGRTQVEWNALNAGEYGSNSTYNGATLPPVILENNSGGFWNSASGRPLDISFHFTKKEKITTLQVKCPPYGGVNSTMTVYYAQKGDTELTLYKEIATISTGDRKAYEFNEEGISADYWVVRFTSSGWVDLRLCSPSGLFTTGLYTEECHQQIMDRFNGYQPVGNYALKNEIIAKSLLKTKGDIIYASDANTPAKLDIGTAGQFLSIADGAPKWVNNPIQDNLTSTSTTDSLSANQGRVLKGLVDSKVNSSDLVELTLTNNGTKRFLIGSGLANTWSDIGTNSSCYTQSGSLYATYFYGTSDRRLKENIKDLDLNCLDLVNNINLREFSWKADKEHKPTIGAVAQELRQVLPEKYVHEFIGGQETDDEYLSINDSKLVYLLIGAIQEQQKEIESLKAKIDGKIV